MSKLNVNAAVLEFAVLEIFDNLNIPGGGRLCINSLAEEWPKSGLRKKDLTVAIEHLVNSGYLAIQPADSVTGKPACLILTPMGSDTKLGMRRQPYAARILARYTISKAKNRPVQQQPAGQAAFVERRLVDQAHGARALVA